MKMKNKEFSMKNVVIVDAKNLSDLLETRAIKNMQTIIKKINQLYRK